MGGRVDGKPWWTSSESPVELYSRYLTQSTIGRLHGMRCNEAGLWRSHCCQIHKTPSATMKAQRMPAERVSAEPSPRARRWATRSTPRSAFPKHRAPARRTTASPGRDTGLRSDWARGEIADVRTSAVGVRRMPAACVGSPLPRRRSSWRCWGRPPGFRGSPLLSWLRIFAWLAESFDLVGVNENPLVSRDSVALDAVIRQPALHGPLRYACP
jgi:hypothetical protein